MGYGGLSEREEELARVIVDAAYRVHSRLGPGLLESIYEMCFCHELSRRSIPFRHQVHLPIEYDGVHLESALRIDVIVDERVICELKSAESMLPVHHAQLLTYMKLTKVRLGFLINFNVPVLKNGIKRIIR